MRRKRKKEDESKELMLILGKPVDRVPSGDSVLILRNGVVAETRPIIEEEKA